MNRQIWIPVSSILQLNFYPTQRCSWILWSQIIDKWTVADIVDMTAEELEESRYWKSLGLYWKPDEPEGSSLWHMAQVEILVAHASKTHTHKLYFKSQDAAADWLFTIRNMAASDWADITPN